MGEYMKYNIGIKNEKSFGDRIILFLFALYFILKPFYFWSSGLPQISDLVFLILIIYYMFKVDFRISFFSQSKIFLLISLGFVLYVSLINTLWSLLLNGSLEILKFSIFYVFNFLASLMVLTLYHEYQKDFLKYLYRSVLIATYIQIVLYILGGGFNGERALGFFNNPNQLGYYNLLLLGFLLMISQRIKLKPGWFIGSITATLVMCFSSLSKAAIVAYAAMFFYFIFLKMKTKLFNKQIVIYLSIITIILSVTCYSNKELLMSNQLYRSVMYRVSTIGSDNDDNLSARGYDRLTDYPQYLAFGSGEGEFQRLGYGYEFHSTLGNILFSYGIIGLFLYLTSIVFAMKSNRWKDAYIIFFIMLYGLTHNGIRNTLLWILVALISIGELNTNLEKEGISDIQKNVFIKL